MTGGNSFLVPLSFWLRFTHLITRSITLPVLPVGCRHEVTGLRPNRRDGTGNE